MITYNKTARDYRQLDKLKDLEDWKIHDNHTDIRGWEVYSNDNMKVGKIENLIVDIKAKEVRYIEIQLEDDLAGLDHLNSTIETRYEKDDRFIIVPIGLINIDDNKDIIKVDKLNTSALYQTPRFDREAGINPDYEIVLYKYLVGPAGNPAASNTTRVFNEEDYVGAPGMEAEFYESPYFSNRPLIDRLNSRRNRSLKSSTHHSLGG